MSYQLTNAQNSLLAIKSRLPFFADLTEEEVLMVTDEVRFVKFKRGEVVFDFEDASFEAYYIINGVVSISVPSGANAKKFVNLANLQKRSLFGEMSAITGELRSARVLALADDTSLLSFKIVHDITEENKIAMAILYNQFVNILADKLTKANAKLQARMV